MKKKINIVIFVLFLISLISVSATTTVINVTDDWRLVTQGNPSWDTAHDDTTGDGVSDTLIIVGSHYDNPNYIIKRSVFKWDLSSFVSLGESVNSANITIWIDTNSDVFGSDGIYSRIAFVVNYTGSDSPVQADIDNCGFVDNPIVITDHEDVHPEPSENWYSLEIQSDYYNLLESQNTLFLCLRTLFDINDTTSGGDGVHIVIGDIEDNEGAYITIDSGGGAVSNPTMTINTNLVNSTQNYNYLDLNISFNATFTDIEQGTDNATCNLFVNELVNSSLFNVNISENQEFTYTFPDEASGWFSFNVTCNATDFSSNDSITNQWYNVDILFPTISSNYVNNSEYNDSASFSFTVNVSDENLFAYNVSFLNTSDFVMVNVFAENLTNISLINTTTIDLNSSWIGNNTIRVEVWDSHTLATIDNYKIDYLRNGLEFEDSVKIYSDNIKESYTQKYKDRYSFSFEFVNKTTWQSLYLESNGDLIYLPNSKYKLHFVDFKNKKWIDFDSISYSDYKITKLLPNKFLIELRVDEASPISFNSIGDLNYYSMSWSFSVVATPAIPTDLEVALDLLNENLDDINTNLESGARGLNMIWFWVLFIIFTLMPILFRDKLGIEAFTGLAGISLFVMIILLVSLIYIDFGITGFFRTVIALALIYQSYRLSMELGIVRR